MKVCDKQLLFYIFSPISPTLTLKTKTIKTGQLQRKPRESFTELLHFTAGKPEAQGGGMSGPQLHRWGPPTETDRTNDRTRAWQQFPNLPPITSLKKTTGEFPTG